MCECESRGCSDGKMLEKRWNKANPDTVSVNIESRPKSDVIAKAILKL